MKRQILLLLTILILCCNSAYAQVNTYINPDTGRIWNNPLSNSLDTAIINQRESSYLQQSIFNQQMMGYMVRDMMVEEFGRNRISSGRANTRFVPMAKNSYIETLVANARTPEEKTRTRAMGELCLQTFNNILKSKGLSVNDDADSSALAFVMSYLVYFDKDPGSARLKKLVKQFHDSLVTDTMYQGKLDKDRQKTYENTAIKTMLGYRAYELSKKQSLSAQERQNALQTARSYAASVLRNGWDEGSIDNIELVSTGNGFDSKGKRLVASGQGTTTFKRSERSAWAEAKAECYDSGIYLRAGDHSCFYDMRTRFDGAVLKVGGTNNDVAYANAVAFKILYPIYADGVQLNAKQFNWVLNEMRKDVSTSPDFQNATDEGKQGFYDSLAYDSMSTFDNYARYLKVYEQAKNRGDRIGELDRDSSSRGLQSSKEIAYLNMQRIFQPRNLEDYELRSDGFVKVK